MENSTQNTPVNKKTAAKAAVLNTMKNKQVQKTLLIGGAVVGSAFLAKYIINKIKKKNTQKRFDEDTVQQAMLLHAAMNPSGISWMMSMDGTSNDTFFNVINEITDFNKVANEYKKLYQNSLIETVEKELSSGEYTRFLNLISTSNPELKKKNEKFILMPKGGKIYQSLNFYPFGSVKEVKENSYLNNPTDMITKSYLMFTGYKTFIHSSQLNSTSNKFYDVWIDMDDVIIASVDTIKAKYKNITKNKVVFYDKEF